MNLLVLIIAIVIAILSALLSIFTCFTYFINYQFCLPHKYSLKETNAINVSRDESTQTIQNNKTELQSKQTKRVLFQRLKPDERVWKRERIIKGKNYCRYCRQPITDKVKIENYFDLFTKQLDPDDKDFIEKRLKDDILCQTCYRPNKQCDRSSHFKVILEIISFWLWVIIFYLPFAIIFSILALIEKIGHKIMKNYSQTYSTNDINFNDIKYYDVDKELISKIKQATSKYTQFKSDTDASTFMLRPAHQISDTYNNTTIPFGNPQSSKPL